MAIEQLKTELDRDKKIGQPFELTFEDAATGKTIDLQKDMKGKVVVIDFWATWCGPCVAEMPNMKKIYGEFHDKGVEFIGISLDAPEADHGKDKAVGFCEEERHPMAAVLPGQRLGERLQQGMGNQCNPQWHVRRIDADGKLSNLSARGKLREAAAGNAFQTRRGMTGRGRPSRRGQSVLAPPRICARREIRGTGVPFATA